ncbi:uncharacterized protein LOC131173359 [Hevea brasiliensis]|uniref:uncharacterized protein LOC131173359 n=1 Tax=Hevea brasiliensis TaxID=3981 RepID=UPI0025EE2F9B|nr:uncharacterized protein LOC110650747 isoform X2 [Hevea brasiliensis]XP_057989361.1 uncharacterized protein LOC110650747 isoform X1 [Hevea brasiliensis]XP_057991642.1 uncharacterized protein LOC131173359 [Hevea brasiliensis]
MESKRGEEEQFNFPTMIAIKGPSSVKKTEIATKLANFLHYPLIDEADVIVALQNSITTSPTNDSNISAEYYDELPFKIACQITSTQLDLELKVIFNTVLSERSHFEHLVQLANSHEACLLVIDCEDENHGFNDCYSVGNVRKLKIDTTKAFVVEEFVPAMLQAVELPQEINLARDEGAFVRGV